MALERPLPSSPSRVRVGIGFFAIVATELEVLDPSVLVVRTGGCGTVRDGLFERPGRADADAG